ncbi:MAG: DNA repair exonuclease [Candidatus Limnocylindrales bacterium]
MSFRFLHTGDLHLDSPFVGLTADAPAAVAQTLREATLQSWQTIVQLALDERVDFVLVAGDVFEQANRTLRGQIRFRDGLADLARARVPSFVVTGNHDPLSGWEPSVTWPELAHRFPARTVSGVQVIRDGDEIARVYGVSHHVRDVTTNLASHFKREAGVPFAVGLLHTNVGATAGETNCAPCTLQDLRAADMDYWALGHIHRHAVLAAGRPTVVYCGNPQGRDPGEADACGCYLVTVDDAGEIHPEFRPADVVRWQLLDVPIAGIPDEESLIERVASAADEARSLAERAIVARVALKGRGALHASLQRPGVLADVRTMAQERLGETLPFAWVESVRDETRGELDLADRRLADDFLGDLLRRFEQARVSLRNSADPEATGDTARSPDRIVAQLEASIDPLYCHERARRYLRDVRPGEARLADLLDEAESMVVDRLGGDA